MPPLVRHVSHRLPSRVPPFLHTVPLRRSRAARALLRASQAGSHAACREMMRPDVAFIRRAWSPASSSLAIAAARFVARARGVAYMRSVFVKGVLCHVYAAADPSGGGGGGGSSGGGSEAKAEAAAAGFGPACASSDGNSHRHLAREQPLPPPRPPPLPPSPAQEPEDLAQASAWARARGSGRGDGRGSGGFGGGGGGGGGGGSGAGCAGDVLLYVHGGAFVASLHAADVGVLAEWALSFPGATILVPQYVT